MERNVFGRPGARPEWLRHLAGWVKAREIRRLARRLARRLQVARVAEPEATRALPDRYFIKAGYATRSQPEYADEPGDSDVIHQPDVYSDAADLASRLHVIRIVDIGCGNGQKLAALYPRFETIGIDFGENLARCRDRYSFGSWREHNLDTGGHLPLIAEEINGSLLIASDVIEHLHSPENLLSEIRRCLDAGASAAVISTPERDLSYGVHHFGPPPNPCHIREWAVDEFKALLAAYGFHRGTMTMTRSDTSRSDRSNILATLLNERVQID
jgi:2-polyprenyl-3-methyl-5-hydroxy-6-metoxy-1,4-benzoquinol methylase